MKIGIVGAVDQEVELLLAEMRDSGARVGVVHRGGLKYHEGMLAGCEAIVVCCGVGKVNAALCAQTIVSEFGATHVINTGAAGGLAEGLRVFDMIASTDAVQHDFDTTAFGYALGQIPGNDSPFFLADPLLRACALRAFALIPEGERKGAMLEGRVATGDVFVAAEALRNRIRTAFSPACVEMEGGAVAQVCALNGVPFLILRSISDLAGHEATVSYDDFSRDASRISARVVLGMMRELSTVPGEAQ